MADVNRAEAIAWKCHDCCGHFVDGKLDCEVRGCALYSWMPYRRLEPDLQWKNFSASRPGLVLKEDVRALVTEEEGRRRAERMNAAKRAKAAERENRPE